jgi:hypothetical protein
LAAKPYLRDNPEAEDDEENDDVDKELEEYPRQGYSP